MGETLKVNAKAYLCGGDLMPEEMKTRLSLLNPGTFVQAVKASDAKNEFFLEMLATQTVRAAYSGTLLAKKAEIDFLLRLAGTTQISRAIREHGAMAGAPFILVAAGRRRLKGMAGLAGLELPRAALNTSELRKVEQAALLSAERP